MSSKITPSNTELITQTLDLRRHHNNNLFDNGKQNPYFWKLSELAITYPNVFDVKKPIQQYTINKLDEVIKNTNPNFYTLETQPIHVLNVKETYNVYLKETNQIKTVHRGTNQYFTNVILEYWFRQYKGFEIEQAYFLYPNKKQEELTLAAQELGFERIRDQIAHTSNLLSAVIKNAHGSNKNSFSEIWSSIWKKLYGVISMDSLRDRYNIKTSPIDYMKPQTLIFINSMLQEIVLNFSNKTHYTIGDVFTQASTKASIARAHFFRYGSKPEEQLTETSSYHVIEKIRKNREKFWKEYYPLSLQPR